MALVLKKEEKLQNTINMLDNNYTKDVFVKKFEELYPKE